MTEGAVLELLVSQEENNVLAWAVRRDSIYGTLN